MQRSMSSLDCKSNATRPFLLLKLIFSTPHLILNVVTPSSDVNLNNNLGSLLIHVSSTGFIPIASLNGTRIGSVDIPLDPEILGNAESQISAFKLQSNKTGDVGTIRIKLSLKKKRRVSRYFF